MPSDFRPHGEANFLLAFSLLVPIILICVIWGKMANHLIVPLHDHVILKTLNACFNALLDDLPICAKNSFEGSAYDTTINSVILENL